MKIPSETIQFWKFWGHFRFFSGSNLNTAVKLTFTLRLVVRRKQHCCWSAGGTSQIWKRQVNWSCVVGRATNCTLGWISLLLSVISL